MNKFLFVILLISLSVPQYFSQDVEKYPFHWLSNTIGFSAEIGGTYPYTDLSVADLDIMGRGSLEYFLPSRSNHTVGFKVIGGGGFLSGKGFIDYLEYDYRTSFFFIGGGIIYALNIGNGTPYISTLVSYLGYNTVDNIYFPIAHYKLSSTDLNATSYIAELGIKFPFASILSLNLGLSFNFSNTDFIEQLKLNSGNDFFATGFIGISIYANRDKDSDNDGVEDSNDQCPQTPPGLSVNDFGCPVDSDADGVPDYLDQCNNTPEFLRVDENGCALDFDKDGVADYFDKCKNTPPGTLVDKNGCPIKKLNLKKDTPQNESLNPRSQNEVITSEKYNSRRDEHIEKQFYTDGNYYSIQVSISQNRKVAFENLNKLLLEKHRAFIIEKYQEYKKLVYYSIRIGPFRTLDDAREYRINYTK